MSEFNHIDEQGHVRMVDVTEKKPTRRTAVAQGTVSMNPATFHKDYGPNGYKRGMSSKPHESLVSWAAKKTSELIPMCHPLNITHVAVDFFPESPPKAPLEYEAAVRTVDPDRG